jgi:Anti-sigma factor NepR
MKVSSTEPSDRRSLEAIGRTLRTFYESLIAEGIPEHLAALVRRIEEREAGHHPDHHQLGRAPGSTVMSPLSGSRQPQSDLRARSPMRRSTDLLPRRHLTSTRSDDVIGELVHLPDPGGELAALLDRSAGSSRSPSPSARRVSCRRASGISCSAPPAMGTGFRSQ